MQIGSYIMEPSSQLYNKLFHFVTEVRIMEMKREWELIIIIQHHQEDHQASFGENACLPTFVLIPMTEQQTS